MAGSASAKGKGTEEEGSELSGALQIGHYRALLPGDGEELLRRVANADARRLLQQAKDADERRRRAEGSEEFDSTVGGEGEKRVLELLVDAGLEVKRMPPQHPFDILVSGKCRIDVKTCMPDDERQYMFHLRKASGLPEACDLYVLSLLDRGLYQLLRAPSAKPYLCISRKRLSGLCPARALAERIGKIILDI
jgi:hypothetical protein